jgi:hypothetical protein
VRAHRRTQHEPGVAHRQWRHLEQKLAAKENAIAKLLAGNLADEKIIEEAYLGCLSRFPTATEKEKLLTVLKAAGSKEQRFAVEDVYWALLSSKEFLFNH